MFLFNLNLLYNGENDAIMNPGESLCNGKLWSKQSQSFHKMAFGKVFLYF